MKGCWITVTMIEQLTLLLRRAYDLIRSIIFMSTPVMPRHKFVALDALRGIAAFIVIFRHMSIGTLPHPMYCSFLAVDFFFLLSGFVLEPTFPKIKGGEAKYILKRIVRLSPAYAAGLILSFIQLMSYTAQDGKRDVLLALVPNLVVLPSPFSENPFPILGPAWSLFAEFWIANIIFTFYYRFLKNRGIYVLVALAALALFVLGLIHGSLDFGFTRKGLVGSVPRVLFSFGIGCILRQKFSPKSLNAGAVTFSAVAIIFVGLMALPLNVAPIAVQIIIISLIFPVMLVVSSRVLLVFPLLIIAEMLGAASYPLYTLHPALGRFFRFLWQHGLFPFAHPTLIAGILSLVISWVFAKFLDEPLRSVLTERFLHLGGSKGASTTEQLNVVQSGD